MWFRGRMSREWELGRADKPDLRYAVELVTARHASWELYVPAIELVPCRHEVKPAIFVKVGQYEYPTWSASVMLRSILWEWHSANPCVVFRMSMFFEDPGGGRLGMGARGQVVLATQESMAHAHRLVCGALFDPTLEDHRSRIAAWANAPGPMVVFFVEERGEGLNYVTTGADRSGALSQLREAYAEAATLPAPDRATFARARAAAEQERRAKGWWS